MISVLRVEDLSTYHGWNHALRGVSFAVNRGELVAVVGANGAGKSTLLGTLAGLYQPCSGQVEWRGQEVTGMKPERMVHSGVHLVPERRQLFASFSVYDNLIMGGYHRWHKDRSGVRSDVERVLALFPALRGREASPAGSLSGGMQQMLAIARGLMARPGLLMLDEPSLGLAPLIVKEIFTVLAQLRAEGTTILLVEQNARAAIKVADRVYVMEQGQIVHGGTSGEMGEGHIMRKAYLGAPATALA